MGKINQVFDLMSEAETKYMMERGGPLPTRRTLYIGQLDLLELKQDSGFPRYFYGIKFERTGRGDFEINGFDAIIVKRDHHLHAVVE